MQLALQLEAAEAAGDSMAGCALDWQKVFDNVGLEAVASALPRTGVHAWLVAPLLSAYSAPRRLRVDGALGETWLPSSGILPGCWKDARIKGVLQQFSELGNNAEQGML